MVSAMNLYVINDTMVSLTLSQTARKSINSFHRNHTLGTLDFTGSEQWAPFSFSRSTTLLWIYPADSAIQI